MSLDPEEGPNCCCVPRRCCREDELSVSSCGAGWPREASASTPASLIEAIEPRICKKMTSDSFPGTVWGNLDGLQRLTDQCQALKTLA